MTSPQTPAFAGNIHFNAQHSPMGAFMSFTCGHVGTGGGIGVEIGKPASQNLFVGVKRGARRAKGPIRCLPFVRGTPAVSVAANFDAEHAAAGEATSPASVECYGSGEIVRRYGWACDTWETEDFSFSIHTPFAPIPDPATADLESVRAALLPAIVATLKVDNSRGTEAKTAVFAIDFAEAGTRLLSGGDDRRVGFAWRRSMGVMGMIEGDGGGGGDGGDRDDAGATPFAIQRWSVAEGVADVNPIHGLGTCGGIGMEVPAGQVRTLVLSIGVYLEGVVTTGLEAKYFYTRHYTSLDDVLDAALDRAGELRTRAARLDARLLASGLSPDQQFLIAHATRGYYGSTQLLDLGGEPFFVVNEGEYCMMNTLDLSIDHAFWELGHNPWVVRNVLTGFARHYSYHDQVKGIAGQPLPGGVSFCHDMGAHNNFSASGESSYELAHLSGCFSFMTQEQLCNWILMAACYVARTNDAAWLLDNFPLITACAQSMRHRADARTGVMAHDSARCADGQEITTYDSLDESLGQARANTYLAVKCWAAWVGIEMLAALYASAVGAGGPRETDTVESLAGTLADHLAQCAGGDGVLPAVLERDSRGYASRILPAVEALLYPAYWLACLRDRGVDDECDGCDPRAERTLASALRHPLVRTLERHTLALLLDPQRRNLFADGGIKLSSTSNNSWMSKIALFQYVVREVLRLCDGDGGGEGDSGGGDDNAAAIERIFDQADAAHVRWQTRPESAYWACSDQFIKGVAKASRYYPRIITTALWLDEAPRAAARAAGTPVREPEAPAASSASAAAASGAAVRHP